MTNLDIWKKGRGTPRNLWDEAFDVFSEMDRMFDRGLIRPAGNEVFMPACEVVEKKNAFEVNLEVPGMSKKDIQIELNGNELVVFGEKKQEKKEEVEGGFRSERVFGSFRRSFTLPKNADLESVDAQYENGLIRLSIPKAKEFAPKKIEVKGLS